MPSNSKGRGSVLPVSAAQTRKPFKQQARAPAPRLRLIIRRLPPGLTEDEFWKAIGQDWQVGNGKTEWAAFKSGKISKDMGKPSRPARAYIKVKETSLLDLLSAHVKLVVFTDAKNTGRDPCLLGPPSLEFAPYNKTPSSRGRHDGRQGTIDQDPEFIDFLQSLTEPITKPVANGDEADSKEKVTITPLIQFIKDKKASKAKEKEAAAAKAATKKPQDSKELKVTTPAKPETLTSKKSTTTETDKARLAKATQQAVESVRKSTAEIKAQAAASKAEASTASPTANNAKRPQTPTQPAAKRERQRGDVSAAARIIGRDLGLAPKEARPPRGPKTAAASVASATASPATASPPRTQAVSNKTTPVSTATSGTTQTSANAAPIQPPTGPRSQRNPPQPSPLRQTPVPQPKPAKPSPQPSQGAKSAFLKHANPSQGVTEELLKSTFSVHGAMTRCEIDKKKGLGYIDFVEPEGLRKAMAASPVKIGNGQVIVLENRSPYKKPLNQSRSANASPKPSTPSSPQLAPATLATVPEQATPAPVNPTNNATTSSTSKEMSGSASEAPAAATAKDGASSETTGLPSSPNERGRGGHRGRGRGGLRGQRHFRGNNRAVSSPVPDAGGSKAAAATPAEAKS